jgi:phosphatidylserine/phosphatidylglycerophosphate/cardiolipin synthase-like enzyme
LQDVLREAQIEQIPLNHSGTAAAETLLREEVEDATSKLRNAVPDERQELMLKLKTAEERLLEAESRAKDIGFRYLSVVDHPPLLADAVKTAKQRLLIISPWISAGVVDGAFLKNLEATLRRGVKVYIGYGISGEEHTKPIDQNYGLKQLIALSNKHPEFHLKRFGNTHAKVLIKDSEFSATTSFNWLSFKGDPNRTFRDEQGVLVHSAEAINSKFEELLLRFA